MRLAALVVGLAACGPPEVALTAPEPVGDGGLRTSGSGAVTVRLSQLGSADSWSLMISDATGAWVRTQSVGHSDEPVAVELSDVPAGGFVTEARESPSGSWRLQTVAGVQDGDELWFYRPSVPPVGELALTITDPPPAAPPGGLRLYGRAGCTSTGWPGWNFYVHESSSYPVEVTVPVAPCDADEPTAPFGVYVEAQAPGTDPHPSDRTRAVALAGDVRWRGSPPAAEATLGAWFEDFGRANLVFENGDSDAEILATLASSHELRGGGQLGARYHLEMPPLPAQEGSGRAPLGAVGRSIDESYYRVLLSLQARGTTATLAFSDSDLLPPLEVDVQEGPGIVRFPDTPACAGAGPVLLRLRWSPTSLVRSRTLVGPWVGELVVPELDPSMDLTGMSAPDVEVWADAGGYDAAEDTRRLAGLGNPSARLDDPALDRGCHWTHR